MSYNKFTLIDIKQTFGLDIKEETDLFASVPEANVSDTFHRTLEDNTQLALAINTEKARSECIIAPVLLELRRVAKKKISLFSGVEFNVDTERGLVGTCDFLITLSGQQLFIWEPVVAIVEAKNENIKDGLAQCITEMLASQIFNEKKGSQKRVIYGIVTTGDHWKFLQLEGTIVSVDGQDYYIKPQLKKIFGILQAMIE